MFHTADKTEREDPLGFFNIHSVAKLPKKLKGDPLVGIFLKKVQCRKNLQGVPLVSTGIVYYAGNLFGSVPWVNIGVFSKFCKLLIELFWSLQVVLRKTLTKEKRRLKIRQLKNKGYYSWFR